VSVVERQRHSREDATQRFSRPVRGRPGRSAPATPQEGLGAATGLRARLCATVPRRVRVAVVERQRHHRTANPATHGLHPPFTGPDPVPGEFALAPGPAGCPRSAP
jgi:hypothetical protein